MSQALATSPASAFAHGSNDVANGVGPLVLTVPLNGNIDAVGDFDYFSFSAVASTGYTISLSDPTPLTAPTDTVILLYGTDGVTALASNDDCPSPVSLLSCLSWTAPSTGTYYIAVRSYANGVGDYAVTVQ